MLTSDLAFVLNLFSIGLLGLLLAVALMTSAWPLLAKYISSLPAHSQARALWLYVAAPWIASGICVLAFLPSMSGVESTFGLGSLAHWHHPYVFYLASWHSVVLSIFLLCFAWVFLKTGRMVIRHLRELRSLTRISQGAVTRWQGRQRITVLDSRVPTAFTAGLVRPECFVTSGLIDQVSERDLSIIIAHEHAHIERRDTARKFLFAAVSSLYPRPVARRMNHLLSLAIEQLADASVGNSYSVFDIAEALVRTAKVQRFSNVQVRGVIASYFISDEIDVRVRALVIPQKLQSLSWMHCLLAVGAIAAASSMCVDQLHHIIEAVFSH